MTTPKATKTKKKTTSPTQLSLKRLRKRGWMAQVVEHWNPWARVRVDLFGCIDIVALDPKRPGLLGIQTTSRANMSARIKKIMAIDAAKTWSEVADLHVEGWDKHGNRWRCKTVALVWMAFDGAWDVVEVEDET